MKVNFLFIILLISGTNLALAQSSEDEESEGKKRHAITASIGHTTIGEGISNGRKRNLILPSWGLNYDYHLNDRWAIGLHTDIIIEEFEVEIEGNDNVLVTIERSRPVSMAVTASHRVSKYLILSAGAGRELAPEENFTIFRFGAEPFFKLPNEFELVATIAFDVRVDAYNAFNFALGIAKFF